MRANTWAVLLAVLVCVSGCGQSDRPPAADMAELRATMQEHTETLLLIHFRLDNALQAISAAELQAEEGGCSNAGSYAAEAYRELQAADSQLLDLGRELQTMVNLDAAGAGQP